MGLSSSACEQQIEALEINSTNFVGRGLVPITTLLAMSVNGKLNRQWQLRRRYGLVCSPRSPLA